MDTGIYHIEARETPAAPLKVTHWTAQADVGSASLNTHGASGPPGSSPAGRTDADTAAAAGPAAGERPEEGTARSAEQAAGGTTGTSP